MQPMDWKLAIENWRRLPADEKARRRWALIPLKVARSMAFAGEPVSLAVLEAEHARRPQPLATRTPILEGDLLDGNISRPDHRG